MAFFTSRPVGPEESAGQVLLLSLQGLGFRV